MGSARIVLLFAAMIALFVIVGWVIGSFFFADPWTGAIIFLLLAAVINGATYFWGDRIVLWSQHAKVVSEHDAPRLHRIVGHLTQMAGLPMPRIAIVQSDAANAFATGRNPKHAVVAATAGILRILDDNELEAVLAHELGHVGHRDTLIMMAAATLAGAIAFAARSAIWGTLLGGGNRSGGSIVGAILVAITAPIAALLVQLAVSRSREFKADEYGGRLCGRPLDLGNALQKLEQQSKFVGLSTNPAQSHLFIVNPLKGRRWSHLFSTHPPTTERVARLEMQSRRP
ncbi:MAG: M48 family metalloprotease [Thermoplasmatota archaeon]